jgi:hypothetical protein
MSARASGQTAILIGFKRLFYPPQTPSQERGASYFGCADPQAGKLKVIPARLSVIPIRRDDGFI